MNSLNIALLLARLILAVVFLVSGVSKLADLAGSRQAFRDFGVPAWLAAPGGLLLPLVELAVAVALLPLASAWWGAVGALALLFLFIIAITYNLARGRKPDCHCFGQLSSRPIGWTTLLRNLVLAAIAGFILGFGRTTAGLSAFAWLSALTLSQRIELGAGLVLLSLLISGGWLLLEMLRQQGRLLLRLEALEERMTAGNTASEPSAQLVPTAPPAGLPVGSPAPAFALPGLFGETITLDYLRASDKPVLLLFSDPGCGPCSTLMPEVGRWQRDYAGKLTIALISRGTVEANRAKAREHEVSYVLLQQDREIAEAYQVRGTPGAVLVRSDGTIGSPLAMGADAIRVLVATAVGLPALSSLPASAKLPGNGHANGQGNGSLPIVKSSVVTAPSTVGSVAPAFSLPDLSGNSVSLSDFRGSPTLLLFWRPSCGFCQHMLSDLKAWEATSPRNAPKLLVVSTGTVEENTAMGLRSPVLLDPDGLRVGRLFGATGTPNAVLVDAQGTIVSQVAAGASAVLALAGVPTPAEESQGGAVAPRMAPTPRVGESAPTFGLPNLSGKRVHLSDFRGSRTLVLFWNPGCGFCQRMLADLKAWEAHPPKGAPKLLVVSTGSTETNRAMGLRSTVLLDEQMSVGSLFGAQGTPMAVLVDAQGKLASPLAAGASEVLTLAGADTERSASKSA